MIEEKLALLPHVNQYYVAYSGGLDSHVLLHLCVQALKGTDKTLQAIHVNHNLSPNSLHWQHHCQNTCEQLQVSLQCVQVNAAPQHGKSPEAVARDLRYQALRDIIKPQACLLTAHHQNDQAETLLLQLLRGAGPAGLAAMPELTSFAQGYLLRPLLNFTRKALQQYALANQLHWIDDESNANTTYDRNFIRHEVIPMLQQRWPAVVTTLSRSATNCAEATALLEMLGKQDSLAQPCYKESGEVIQQPNSTKLSLDILRHLDKLDPTYTRSRNVIRTWLKQQNFIVPNRSRLQQLYHDFLYAKKDANPYMTWDNVEIRRFQDALYAMPPLQPIPGDAEYHWDLNKPLKLPNGLGTLTCQKQQGEGFVLPDDMTTVTVRFRRGGERCQLPGRLGSHSLKKLLQEWHIPPWQRDRIPLIYYQDKLVAVVGLVICEPFTVRNAEKRLGCFISIFDIDFYH